MRDKSITILICIECGSIQKIQHTCPLIIEHCKCDECGGQMEVTND